MKFIDRNNFIKVFLGLLFFLNMGFAAVPKYGYLDPQNVVPPDLLEKAVVYYDQNLNQIQNKKVLTVADFSQPSYKPRLFIINMKSGEVKALRVAHGKGSDPKNTGVAQKFSNKEQSRATSLGFYLTGETYVGKHGYSLKLDGLSPTNSNARDREIVIHGAPYVSSENVGHSFGCFAVAMRYRTPVIKALANGSLIYAGVSDVRNE